MKIKSVCFSTASKTSAMVSFCTLKDTFVFCASVFSAIAPPMNRNKKTTVNLMVRGILWIKKHKLFLNPFKVTTLFIFLKWI